jgi:putative nucleotidyltransferase with HDIG domain
MEMLPNNLLDRPAVGGIVVNARDISEARRTTFELARVNRLLRAVTEADAAVVHATAESDLLAHMCRVVVDTGGYAMAWIALRDPARPERVVTGPAYGSGLDYHEALLAAYGGGPVHDDPATRAVLTGQTQVLQDVTALQPGSPLRELALEHGFRSQLALPLVAGSDVIGALSIHARDPEAFTEPEVLLLRQLADDLAYGIVSLRARVVEAEYVDRLERNLEALVGTIAAASEARDPYTAGHQKRVALLSVAIARELAIDADTVIGIGVAASIHDIGKISIPSEILSKPGSLSRYEFELIKEHARAGFEIIKGIEFPWPVARMVLEHHERLDGSGYPDGLHGDEIFLGSRIIAIADVVEAMASHRPYRPALGIDAALTQVSLERGIQLDADAVDACARLFSSGRFAFDTSGAAGSA